VRLPLKPYSLFLLILLVTACSEQADNGLPDGVQWQTPQYSRMFLFGVNGKDSFIALKNPSDTSQWLQIIHWGSNTTPKNCISVQKRNRIACMTAVFSGMMEVLQTETLICCTDNTKFHTGPKCQKWFSKSKVTEAGKGVSIDMETLLKSNPDLVLTYYIDNKGREEWNGVNRNGIPVIFLQNYLETHPLARAEWLKVFGWLLGKPDEAETFFSMVREHYESLAANIKESNPEKPTVFCNAPYSGNWDVPAGESYMAAMFADAGADYLWKDVKGAGKITLDIEKVYQKARNADFWINPGSCRTKDCLTQIDRRLGLFDAGKTGGIFNATKTQNPQGGNAWWDYAVVRPDLALRDLIQIFHPDLVPEQQETIFFEALKD
jgi:iron complex transport system substrate-binding protein